LLHFFVLIYFFTDKKAAAQERDIGSALIASYRLGKIFEKTGQIREAIAWYEREQGGRLTRESAFKAAQLYEQIGNPSKAIQLYRFIAFDQYMDHSPIDSVAFELSDVEFRLAQIFEEGSDGIPTNIDSAIYFYQRVASKKAEKAKIAQFRLGLLYKRQGDWANAQKWLPGDG
jgi:TPR repeat protein